MTDVRFSTRSLLVVTAIVAIAATALGAFLRQFPAVAQLRLFLYWLLLFVTIAIVVAYFSYRRYRAEKQAGTVLFSLVPHSYVFPKPAALQYKAQLIYFCICAPLN